MMTATDILSALAAGTTTAESLMQETLDRVDQINPVVNAIVSLRDRADLLNEARASDAARRAGPVGALHGLPMAVKDLADVKGIATSQGSPVFEGQIAGDDSLFVARLRAAGAIFIGKTNTPEFGLGSHTFNPLFGATLNPYETSKTPGGSSGGAAVSLATGMLSLADGSDMMGSLRNPAGWCNVYGMRPTWGLIPQEPGGEVFLHRISTMGPMARNPRDLALLLSVMAGPDPRLPVSEPVPDLSDIAPASNGLTLAWLGDWGGAFPMEAGILSLMEQALAGFADLGCEVRSEAAPFSADEMWEAWTVLRSWSIAMSFRDLHADPASRARLKPEAVWEIERGLKLSAGDIQRASEQRSAWFSKAVDVFETCDVMVLPSAQVWPFDVELNWPAQIEGRKMDSYHRWMHVMVPASLIGLPVVNVPAGFGANGLPMGMQLIGRNGSDAVLLRLAQAWHEATDWPGQRPPDIVAKA